MTTDVPEGPREGQATGPRFIRLLSLVKPPSPRLAGPKKRHRAPPVFSEAEEKMLRMSMRSARAAAGSWGRLARMMQVTKETLSSVACGHERVTAEIAVRLSKALRIPLERLMSPGLRPVQDPGPTCVNPDGVA